MFVQITLRESRCAMLTTLILCMVLDYLTGMIVAGIFHKSKKSAQGGLESRSGWKGLCRKGVSLLIVLVAYRLDLIAGTDFICNAVMAAYLMNELLSIMENIGLMGIPIPKVLSGAIDLLKQKSEVDETSDRNTKDTNRQSQVFEDEN